MIILALCLSGSLAAGVLQKSADVEAQIKQLTIPNTGLVRTLVGEQLEPIAHKHAPALVKKVPADRVVAFIERIEALSPQNEADNLVLCDLVLELNGLIGEINTDKAPVNRLYYRLLDRVRELANAKLSQDPARIAKSRK